MHPGRGPGRLRVARFYGRRGATSTPAWTEIEPFESGTVGSTIPTTGYGILDGGNNGTGTVTVDNAWTAEGGQSMKVDVTTSSAFNRFVNVADGGLHGVPRLWVVGSFRLSAIPTIAFTPLFSLRLGATNLAQVGVTSGGVVRVRNNITGVADTVTVVQPGVGYTVGWFTDALAGTQTLRLFEPGGDLIETVLGVYTQGLIDNLNWGFIQAPGIAMTGWWDRVGYSTVAEFGPPQGVDRTLVVPSRALWAAVTHSRPVWARPGQVETVPDAAAVADVPAAAPAGGWRRDSAPPQTPRLSVVGLLDSALLESPILGGAETGKRATPLPATGWSRVKAVQADQSTSADADLPPSGVPPTRLSPATHARPGWQRPAVAEPAPDDVAVDVPAAELMAGWRRDPTPAQQSRAPVVGLLEQALLEGGLLGAATTGLRAGVPASHAPRVWQAQQPLRAATSPGLLDSALLEAPLLRPGTTAAAARLAQVQSLPPRPVIPDDVAGLDPTSLTRANITAATHRRDQATRQRTVPDPALLGAALLEDPLIGGATTGLRAGVPATHADRRETVPPRVSLADQSTPDAVDYDPTTAPAARTVTPHLRTGWVRPWAAQADQATQAVDYDPTLAPPARTVTPHLRPNWSRAEQAQADQSATPVDYDPTLAPRALPGAWRDYWTRPAQPRADQSTIPADVDPTTSPDRWPRLAPATHTRPGWARTNAAGADQSTPAADVPHAADRWHLPATHARPGWARAAPGLADQSTADVPHGLDRWHQPVTHSRPGWARPTVLGVDQSTTADIPHGLDRWHQPATHSRDKTTVQRAYLSDPGLLATALLEPPLLVDTRPRSWLRPGSQPTRPAVYAPPTPAPDADPLTLTGQVAGRARTPATHAARPVLRWARLALVDVGVPSVSGQAWSAWETDPQASHDTGTPGTGTWETDSTGTWDTDTVGSTGTWDTDPGPSWEDDRP
jgi:hypothetical protein